MNQLGVWPALVSSVFRAIPAGWRGKARLARWALGRSQRQDDVLLPTRWGELVIPSLQEPIGFHLLIDGVYEPECVRFLEQHLQPGGSFVDVGANIGVLTLVAARLVGATGQLLAAEASEKMFSYLGENLSRNGFPHVALRRCAVCEEDYKSKEFYEAPVDRFGMGSLAPQFYAPPTAVPTRTLDSLLKEAEFPAVDVLKVDVEGFEAAVFRGAGNLLSGEKPPLVLFEFADWAETRAGSPAGLAQQILREKGYRIARLPDWLDSKKLLEQPVVSGQTMLVGLPPDRHG